MVARIIRLKRIFKNIFIVWILGFISFSPLVLFYFQEEFSQQFSQVFFYLLCMGVLIVLILMILMLRCSLEAYMLKNRLLKLLYQAKEENRLDQFS